jgi:hypothetical protein
MASYQNDTATKGEYMQVSNGNGTPPGGKSMKKWIIAGILVVVVGIVLIVTLRKPPGSSTQEAIAKSDLPMSHDGSLLLFDDLSECVLSVVEQNDAKYCSLCRCWRNGNFSSTAGNANRSCSAWHLMHAMTGCK